MLNKILEWLHEKNMIPCKCGCRDDHWNIKATIEGHVCEAEIVCDKCGKVVNYWAYGRTEWPETYTDLIIEKVRDMLNYFNLKQRYKHWRFKRLIKRNPRGF